MREMEDSGSATVWVMIASSVMLLMGGVALLIAIGFVEHRRASAAADLAALAAATQSVDDELVACESAASTAAANGAQLVGCELANRTVLVVVSIDAPAPWLPAMQVAARAGYEP